MTNEEAEKYCERMRADVDKWGVRAPVEARVSVAYWTGEGKSRKRIFKVGKTLAEAVQLCQDAEAGKKPAPPPAEPTTWNDPSMGYYPGC